MWKDCDTSHVWSDNLKSVRICSCLNIYSVNIEVLVILIFGTQTQLRITAKWLPLVKLDLLLFYFPVYCSLLVQRPTATTDITTENTTATIIWRATLWEEL